MTLRHKKRTAHLQNYHDHFQPVLGLLSHSATLNCQLNSHQHLFNIDFQHPLDVFTKLSRQSLKYAFEKIVEVTFDVKVQKKTTFVPEALLTGNYAIIHEYKKTIQRGRIGSYIRLNIKHEQKSYEKKRPISLDIKEQNKQSWISESNIFAKVFNQKTVNQRNTKNLNLTLKADQKKQIKQLGQQPFLTPVKKERSFTSVKLSNMNKLNEQNLNIHLSVKQEHKKIYTNQTHIHSSKKKPNSSKKLIGVEGIKINYIEIKGSQENPQKQTFIYNKSWANLTNRQKSQIGAKTQLLSPHIIHFDKTLDNEISFSVNDKTSLHSHFKEIDDNLSVQFQKSIKNSETSQLTHNQFYTNSYFADERKILKKGKKSVFVQNFQKLQIA